MEQEHGNFLEEYQRSIDKSNFNVDNDDYIKGSYLSKNTPTLKGENHIEIGDIRIEIVVQGSDSNIIRFHVAKHDEDGNVVNHVTALITQDAAREIGNQMLATLFNPNYALGLTLST